MWPDHVLSCFRLCQLDIRYETINLTVILTVILKTKIMLFKLHRTNILFSF